MASYHFTLKPSASTKASADMRADYICREGKYGVGTKAEELLYKEHGNMPEWAQERPREFWEASEIYERSNGTTFREIEFALPNELNLDQQKELVKKFIDEHLGTEFVYSYGIHSKAASLNYGIQNPHVHIMFCERKLDGIARSKEQFFKRANHLHPERGGVKKDPKWNDKTRSAYLVVMREHYAKIQNEMLEREGFSVRVDHRSNDVQFQAAVASGDLDKAQLLDRPAERHLGPKQSSKVARDLKKLTRNVQDPAARNAVRREYWESLAKREQMQKVYQMRQIRVRDRLVHDFHELDQKRSLAREAHPDKAAIQMYWYAKRKEVNALRSKLDLEKYRLDRAAQTGYDPVRLKAWRGYYAERVKNFEELTNKVQNQILTEKDKIYISKMVDGISRIESNNRMSREVLLETAFAPTASHNNVVAVSVLQAMSKQRIDEINSRIKAMETEQRALDKKMYSWSKAQRIAEWRISKGILAGISRDENKLKDERKRFKEAAATFEKMPYPFVTKLMTVKEYEDEKKRLSAWEADVKAAMQDQQQAMDEIQKELGQKQGNSFKDRIFAQGLAATMKTQEAKVKNELKRFEKEKAQFDKLHISPPSHDPACQQYESEKVRLATWEKEIQKLSLDIQARRKAWNLRKERPEVKAQIFQLRNKILEKNKKFEVKLKQVSSEISTLKQERSEWNQIQYSLKQAKDTNRQIRFKDPVHQPQQILQQARSIHSQLQQAVSKLREERPRGRVGVKLKVEEEIAPKRSSEQEMER